MAEQESTTPTYSEAQASCTSETCRRILMDDENFGLGYLVSTKQKKKKKSFLNISNSQHKHLRKLIVSPFNGHESLCKYDEAIIIYLLLGFLLADHETCAYAAMWATEEQEEIIKKRPSTQKGLRLKEVKQSYTIPKGWKVLVWKRFVHMDPEIYPNPKQFDPSRWDISSIPYYSMYLNHHHITKPGSFIPFGIGSRICPGAWILDFRPLNFHLLVPPCLEIVMLEQLNPRSPVVYLPIPRPSDNCLAKVVKLP
ncbi:hypothetical protein ACOSQ2_000084 [Xanthoceras sorbifolium]